MTSEISSLKKCLAIRIPVTYAATRSIDKTAGSDRDSSHKGRRVVRSSRRMMTVEGVFLHRSFSTSPFSLPGLSNVIRRMTMKTSTASLADADDDNNNNETEHRTTQKTLRNKKLKHQEGTVI